MAQPLVQLPQFFGHLFPAVKSAGEHIPGFQAGHGRSTAADQGFAGHFNLPQKDLLIS
jgi:hypothetical protein